MEIALNIEGEVVGINYQEGTILILKDHKFHKYPINRLTIEV